MASVTGADRGQLVLVTAVSIAALLILVAVLLSSVVFTENVATRDEHGVDARAAQLHRVAAVEGVEGILERSNREGSSYAEFRARVATWDEQHARNAAAGGASARVSVASTTNGTRIAQTNATRTLTNASGNASWELVSGADSLRWWTLTVNESSLVTADSATATDASLRAAGVFHVNVTTGPEVRRLFVYRNASDGAVVAHVLAGNGTLLGGCPATPMNWTVTIDVSARTVDPDGPVGPDACTALAALDDGSGPFDVSYGHGVNATGTYSLVVPEDVDSVTSSGTDGDFAYDGSSPFAAPHVSDVTLHLTYTTADLRYRVWDVPVAEEGSP